MQIRTTFPNIWGEYEQFPILLAVSYNISLSDIGYACCARLGQGIGPIHIDDLACSGSEYRLSNCRYDSITSEDSHSEDWGVYCHVGQCLKRQT